MKLYGSILLMLVAAQAMAAAPAVQECQQAIRSGEFDKAVAAARHAVRENSGDSAAQLCLGRAQGRIGAHAEALAALREAATLATAPVDHMLALILLGHEHKSAKEYAEALQYYQQSWDIAKHERNQYFQRANLIAIGEIQSSQQQHDAALENYQQAMKLSANDNERADTHSHLATSYYATGKIDEAIAQQVKATVMEERSGDLDHYAQAQLDLGRYYLADKALERAERAFSKLLEVSVANEADYWTARVYLGQAQLRVAQGKAEEGALLRQKASEIASKIGADELSREIQAAANPK